MSKIDLDNELDVKTSKFEISPTTDTLIFGDKGTGIFIESNSLQFKDGSTPTSTIKIELKEYYSISDILSKNLSTISNGRLLETGGMINIQAFSDGKELELKNGKEVIIHFPKDDSKSGMQLFSESQSDSKTDAIEWKEEPMTVGYEIDTITPFIIKYKDLDSEYMELTDGTNIWNWLEDNIVLTTKERDYVRFRDVRITFDVSKLGKVTNVKLGKGFDRKICKRLVKIIEETPSLKPFKRSGNPIVMECSVLFEINFIPPKYKENTNYLKTIEGNYPDFGNKSINEIDQVELNYYILNSAKLGWLNCDRFVDDPSPKVTMNVKLKKPQDHKVKLIYKDLKSVLIPRIKGKTQYFEGIPENKDVTLMIIRQTKGKLEMSITQHQTKDGNINQFKFKEYTMSELKKELEKLN
jgi:hypothetical protein